MGRRHHSNISFSLKVESFSVAECWSLNPPPPPEFWTMARGRGVEFLFSFISSPPPPPQYFSMEVLKWNGPYVMVSRGRPGLQNWLMHLYHNDIQFIFFHLRGLYTIFRKSNRYFGYPRFYEMPQMAVGELQNLADALWNHRMHLRAWATHVHRCKPVWVRACGVQVIIRSSVTDMGQLVQFFFSE